MADILLLSIPTYSKGSRPYIVGISSLQTYLKNGGIDSVLIDPVSLFLESRNDSYEDALVNDLKAYDIGGASSELVDNFRQFLEKKIEQHHPKYI